MWVIYYYASVLQPGDISAESGQSSDKKGGNKHMLMHWRITVDGAVCHEIALFVRVVCGTGFVDWLEKRFMFEKILKCEFAHDRVWLSWGDCVVDKMIILRWLCMVDRMLKSSYWLPNSLKVSVRYFKKIVFFLHSHEYVFRLCIDFFSFLFA